MLNDNTLSITDAAEKAVSTLNEDAAEDATPEVVESEVDGGVEDAKDSAPEGDEPVEEETKEDKTDEVETEEETETPKADEEDTKTDDAETDFEHIDPKTLPKELQPMYKNLMKGFTQGRQKDSEVATKAHEELEALKIEVKALKDVKPETPKKEETPKFNTPEEYYDYIAEKKAKEAIKTERVKAYRETAVADYPKLDKRLDEKGEHYDIVFDKAVGAELDSKLSDHIKETGSEIGFDFKSEFTRFKGEWDEYVTGNVKKYISKQDEIAKKNAEKTRKKTPKSSPATTAPAGIKTVRDAIRASKEKLLNK